MQKSTRRSLLFIALATFLVLGGALLTGLTQSRAASPPPAPITPGGPTVKTETATFGMGCFWCSQALFDKFRGVTHTVVGYAGGHTENPTYEDVCGDQTGHAECVQVTYDPKVISYAQLLDIFWNVHDPTTLNRQGDDAGTQYRSIILYSSPGQQKLAEAAKAAEAARRGQAVTTEIVPLQHFYPAEDYHQDYFKKNPHAPYCLFVIDPKLLKLEMHPPTTVKPIK